MAIMKRVKRSLTGQIVISADKSAQIVRKPSLLPPIFK